MLTAPFYGLLEALGHVSTYEVEHGRPMLTALVVNKETRIPGEGFASLGEHLGRRVANEEEFWHTELAATVELWSRSDPVLLLDAAVERLMRELVTIKDRVRRGQPAEAANFLRLGAPQDAEFEDWFNKNFPRLARWVATALAGRLGGKVSVEKPGESEPLVALIEVPRGDGTRKRVGVALAIAASSITYGLLREAMRRYGCDECYVVGPTAPSWISEAEVRRAHVHHEPIDRLRTAARGLTSSVG